MNESLNELHRKLSTVGNRIPPNYRFFIVGGLLRANTSTAYDDIAPAEIMIDNSIRLWLETCIVSLLEHTIHCDLLNINEVDEPGDTVKRYIQLDALSQLQQWKQYIEDDQEISNARDFINNEDFKPKCLIAELTVGEENFTFIKVITENVLLKTRKIFKYVEARDGYVLDEERNRKLFLDDQWDGIIFDHKVILYNEGKLLTLFKYYEKFREAAQNVVSQLDVLEFLSSTAELYAFAESTISLQKKLAQVSNYQIERISTERITNLINEGTINLRLNAEGKVECTTKDEAKIFIDVLLDNFVSSLITDDRYKAHNKSRL